MANDALKAGARWRAVVHYRTNTGIHDVEFYLEEIEDLHMQVERGPNWDTVAGIEIRRVNPIHPELTLEQAAIMASLPFSRTGQ